MAEENTLWDELIKIGLILSSIWLGSEIIKDWGKKRGENNEG